MARIVVGTSSWADPGFVEEWYPPDLPERERLPYYAKRFDGVEVNSTWYAIPSRSTVQRWADVTPKRFTFDVKLHRLLSRHAGDVKSLPAALRDDVETTRTGRVRLADDLEAELADRTLKAMKPLIDAKRLSSFLVQLTPGFKPRAHDLDELAGLAAALAPHPLAVEFRHKGWLDEDRREATFAWLEEHRCAFVAVDAPRGKVPTLLPAVDAVTNPKLAYLRAHGRNARGWIKGRTVAERFGYRYDDGELRELIGRAEDLSAGARIVRMMFNNNRGGDAPEAAQRTRELLAQRERRAA